MMPVLMCHTVAVMMVEMAIGSGDVSRRGILVEWFGPVVSSKVRLSTMAASWFAVLTLIRVLSVVAVALLTS